MRDHGTWSKHVTVHLPICTTTLIIEIMPKLYNFERSAKFACVRLQWSKQCPSLDSSALSKLNTPLCTEIILLVEIQI